MAVITVGIVLAKYIFAVHGGPVGAKLQNATSDFFELDLSKNHPPVKWLP